jgi:cardiolipin synthase
VEERRIPGRLNTGNKLLHYKFAYIDETILVNGSANWTNAAFKVNDDYFIVLYPLTPEQQAKMNKLWSVIVKESEKPSASPAPTYIPGKKQKRRQYSPWKE